jgi:hypothetical protein
MKIIKLMLTGIVILSFALAQDGTQGGPPTGPPPCDPNATYSEADPGPEGGCANYNDCNGNGAYDVGEPCGDGQGPPAFGDVDANGDGGIDREEARAFFGQDKEGNDDPGFDAGFDDYAGEDGVVDEAEFVAAAADQGNDQGQPTCDVCGYAFAGEGDHHGHCDKCEFVFSGDNDQHGHCDQCDHIFSGDGNQQHGHCGHEGCDFVGNSDEDWQNHHHDGDMTGDMTGDGDHQGFPAPTNHWDGNCGAMCEGHGEYWLDSDGDGQPEDGPYATWDHDADGNPVDCGCGGDDDQQGPDPFQQAFMNTMQNGGTPDDAFEAVAAVFYQMEVECDDCEMTEEEFQEGKAEAKSAFDDVLANGGTPEEAMQAAMEVGDEGDDKDDDGNN